MKKFTACILAFAFLLISSIASYAILSHRIKTLEEIVASLPKEPMVIEVIHDIETPLAEEPEEEKEIPEPDPEPAPVIENSTPTPSYSSLATMIAKVVWGEARGLGQTEQSCVVWTILNRAEAWGKSVEAIITAPNQFYYDPGFPTVDDHGRDIVPMVEEILTAWENEDDSIRTLPRGYFFYVGDGSHNYFYADYNNPEYWDYAWGSPYSD